MSLELTEVSLELTEELRRSLQRSLEDTEELQALTELQRTATI